MKRGRKTLKKNKVLQQAQIPNKEEIVIPTQMVAAGEVLTNSHQAQLKSCCRHEIGVVRESSD